MLVTEKWEKHTHHNYLCGVSHGEMEKNHHNYHCGVSHGKMEKKKHTIIISVVLDTEKWKEKTP